MYSVNSIFQLYQEEKYNDIGQRQKIGTINVDFSGKEQVFVLRQLHIRTAQLAPCTLTKTLQDWVGFSQLMLSQVFSALGRRILLSLTFFFSIVTGSSSLLG